MILRFLFLLGKHLWVGLIGCAESIYLICKKLTNFSYWNVWEFSSSYSVFSVFNILTILLDM